MAKDSFVLYTEYLTHTSLLTDEEMGKLFRAILLYVGQDIPVEELDLSPAAAMAFSFIRSRLDWDAVKYEEKCKKNAENGRKGGLAKAANALANSSEAKQTLANPSESKRSLAKPSEVWRNLHDSESEFDSESGIEIENESVGEIDALARVLALPPSFSPKLYQWFAHKQQKSGKQTESAMKSLLKLIKKNIDKHGEDAVADLIDYSIHGGYGSIYFDRLEKKQEKQVGEMDYGSPEDFYK